MTTERQVRVFVRNRRREHDPRRLSDRLIDIYTWFLAAVVAGIVVAPMVKGDLVPHPDAFLDTLEWLPVVLLVAVWGVARFATWQGPVLFTAPELQWEVSSPLDRRRLVLMKMRRASVVATVVGVVGGVVIGIGAAALLHRDVLAMTAAAVLALTALALLSTALSWHVERSPSFGKILDRSTPAVVLFAGLLVVAVVRGMGVAAFWSGPWGWSSGPIIAQGGRSVGGWAAMAALLGLAAIWVMRWTVKTADWISDDELWRRAEAHSSAAAALFFGNVRAAKNIARRGRSRGRVRGRDLRMARMSPQVAIVARDLLTLRRNPGLVWTAGAYVAVAVAAAVASVDRAILMAGTFLGLYLAATRLIETIRLESDQKAAHRMLPWPWGIVILLHCVVPVAALTVLGWLGVIVAGIGGFIAPVGVWALIALAPFISAVLVLPAAIAASRRSFPMGMLISGAEMGALSLVTWLMTGPFLSLIALGIASGWIRTSLARGVGTEMFTAIAILGTAAFAFGSYLKSRPAQDE